MSRTRREGFTMIDVMLAIAIVAILGAAAMPVVYGYLTRGTIDATVRDVVTSARYAQAGAQAGLGDSSWGISITGGTITIFQGTSYTARDASYDQTTSYASDITVTGTSEYVFAERTGRTTGGTLTLTTSSAMVRDITVSTLGTINF